MLRRRRLATLAALGACWAIGAPASGQSVPPTPAASWVCPNGRMGGPSTMSYAAACGIGGGGGARRPAPIQSGPTAADLVAQARNNAVALANQGVQAAIAHDYATAFALLTKAHGLWPENVSIWNNLVFAQSQVTNQRQARPVDASLGAASAKIASIQQRGGVDTSGLEFGSGPGNSGGLGMAPDTGHDVGPAKSTQTVAYPGAGAQLGGAAASASDIQSTPRGDTDHVKSQSDCVFANNGGECHAGAALAPAHAAAADQADAIAKQLGPAVAGDPGVKASLDAYRNAEQNVASAKASIADYQAKIDAGGPDAAMAKVYQDGLKAKLKTYESDQDAAKTQLTTTLLNFGVALPPELAPPAPAKQ